MGGVLCGEYRSVNISDVNLTLFFTGGIGLKTWAEVGNLSREVAVYNRLAESLKAVNFVTYGGSEDMVYAERVGDIGVYPVKWSRRLPFTLGRLLLHHRRMLMESDILKTNQIPGAEVPIWLKKRYNKKLIVRCGYLHSRFFELRGEDDNAVRAAKVYEKRAFEAADVGIVPTERDKLWVVETHGIEAKKMRVIPNYVDTERFTPKGADTGGRYDLVFVGRTHPQKNLAEMLRALSILKEKGRGVSALFVGGCADDGELRKDVKSEGLNVSFSGNLPNEDLPASLSDASVFILPSLYEGHPKTLLEAMGCGMPCIGTDVEGIREQIVHQETGYLCKTDAESIAEAIDTVLSDEGLRKKMGEGARRHIVENLSLERVLEMELEVIKEVAGI